MVCDKLIDFLRKKFATSGVIWLFCSLIVESVFAVFIGMDGEISDINCFVPKDSLQAHKKQVDKACLLRYKEFHEPVLSLRYLSAISTAWYAIVTIFYVAVVHHRVEGIESDHKQQIDDNGFRIYGGKNKKFVLFSYFSHHLLCSVFGITLTGLQYPFFHPNGFSKDFVCALPPELQSFITNGQNASYVHLTSTSIDCESADAGPYKILNICLSVVNIFLAVVLLVDLICVSFGLKQHYRTGISLDVTLVVALFLGKHLPSGNGDTSGESGSPQNKGAGAIDTSDEDGSYHTPRSSPIVHWQKN